MKLMEFECKKCGSICEVDGEYPEWLVWCYECNDYAEGFNDSEFNADYFGSLGDEAYDRLKDK